MPELQMDVAVANRFIASLSKSLQALCHGCMDFDSGIEIVGYINVNIDSGSKVDYVLNEKVLKSTTNSMTFVSNSFLARKEHPKQVRDGACSPIFEMNQQSPAFQNRARGYFHGTHSRGATPVSHSYMFRGSQKRSWTGIDRDWRSSKKQRDGRQSYPSPHETTSTALGQSSASSQGLLDTNFKWPQSSVTGSDTTDSHPEINIKKELIENDSGKSSAEAEQEHAFEQDANVTTDPVSDVTNIKSDPDASTAAPDEETATNECVNESDSDFKRTFLEMSTSEETQTTSDEKRNQTDTNDDSETFGLAEHSGETGRETAKDNPEDPTAAVDSDNIPGSEAQYDETAEEGTYPHSVYSDAGEGSSDAGQFEVIEIEDEDEDVQAMFGESHKSISSDPNRDSQMFAATRSPNFRAASFPQSVIYSASSSHRLQTSQHPDYSENSNGSLLKSHMSEQHSTEFPYVCSLCGKGYLSSSGLYRHIGVHKGKRTFCTICDSRFTQTSTLRRHLITVHSLMPCTVCKALVRLGVEYNQHKQFCGSVGLNN